MLRMDIYHIAVTIKLQLNLRVRFELEISWLRVSNMALHLSDLLSIKRIINSFPKLGIAYHSIDILLLEIFILHNTGSTI